MTEKSVLLTHAMQFGKLLTLLCKTGLRMWESDARVSQAIHTLVRENQSGEKLRENVLSLAIDDAPALKRVRSEELGLDFIVVDDAYAPEPRILWLETHGKHDWGHNKRISRGDYVILAEEEARKRGIESHPVVHIVSFQTSRTKMKQHVGVTCINSEKGWNCCFPPESLTQRP